VGAALLGRRGQRRLVLRHARHGRHHHRGERRLPRVPPRLRDVAELHSDAQPRGLAVPARSDRRVVDLGPREGCVHGRAAGGSIALSEVVFSAGETARVERARVRTLPVADAAGPVAPQREQGRLRSAELGPRTSATRPCVARVGLVPTGSFAAEVQSWTIGDAGGDADSAVDPGESVTLAVRATATAARSAASRRS
jgi:hypothetical protein